MATEKKVPEITTVTMDDTRIVDFPGKTRLLKESSADSTDLVVRMDFRNGETRTFRTPHGLGDIDTKAKAFLVRAAGHGLEQKFGDATAGVPNIEDAIEVVDQLMDRLNKFEWNVVSAGGNAMAGASVLARALVEVSGQPIQMVREMLANMDKKTKDALRVDAEVAPVIKRLEAEAAAKAAARGKVVETVNTDAIKERLRSGLGFPPAAAAAEGAAGAEAAPV